MPRTPLVAPTDYFRQPDRPSLARAAAFVLLEGGLVSVVVWVFMQHVISQLDISTVERARAESAVSGVIVGTFVAFLVGWLVLAVVLHVFVWFADGTGGFATTLAVVGEAELVGVVLLPFSAVALYLVAGQVPADPQAAAEFFQRATSTGSPVLLLVSLVGTFWKAAIQGYGLAESQGMDPGKALALAVVVGLVGFLLNLA